MWPEEISFSHNGEAIVAFLSPDGGCRFEEICYICEEPLGNRSFYAVDPFLVYIHADCAAASLPTFQSRPLSAEQSRRIPQHNFPSAPPTNVISYPSYNYNSYPYDQAPNYNYNYPTSYQPAHNYYHNNHHYPPPHNYNSYPSDQANYYQPPHNYYHNQDYPPPHNYHHTPYNQFYHPHTSSSISSVPVWAGVAGTVAGSLLDALLSWISES